jgi:hypothetical protein
MMVIEQLAIDPWKKSDVRFDLPDGYEVLRADLLPSGHYGLWVLFDGDAPTRPRHIHVVGCSERLATQRFEFPNHHRYLAGIHPDGFDTSYYLFEVEDPAPESAG